MITGASNISFPVPSYTIAQYGKMSLPVDTSSLIYSHFENVSGTPAPEGSPGVSISKLHLLDVLISQLNKLEKAAISQSQTQSPADPTGGVDSLIEKLGNQIQKANFANQSIPYSNNLNAEAGILFNILS